MRLISSDFSAPCGVCAPFERVSSPIEYFGGFKQPLGAFGRWFLCPCSTPSGPSPQFLRVRR